LLHGCRPVGRRRRHRDPDVRHLAGRHRARRGQAARATAETRFEIGFQQASVGAAIADLDGIPICVNETLRTLLGRSEDSLIHRLWTDCIHPDDKPLRRAVRAAVAGGRDTYADERRFLRPVRNETGNPEYFFVQFQDIDRRKEMEEELTHQALHDSLTVCRTARCSPTG
jgi:PAS domain S-box-containing protein